MKPRIADALVIAILLIFAISLRGIFTGDGAPSIILVTEKDKRTLPFHDSTYDLTDEIGNHVILEVNNSRVRFIESDCNAKVCIRTGWISGCGEAAVCAPNKVAVYIECSDGAEADAVSR
ncbi:NusG domain II-containing protein [Limisalsivibrio acetivorans]|uniref:NusG domain II-containing protein n=1 Tax=Limisalsivibrio acetivorans TaxID=1304888 RepID=UPI0003B6F076|nr:NusG domain II-containing protein [Limisalsivibrio acetivorans]